MTSRGGTISGANQTVLDELSESGKAKIPADVCKQLITDFVPAVKEVSKAGSELLKVYQAFEKSSTQYVNALETVANSSKKAFPGAKIHGDGLNELVTQYARILDQHKKCVNEFSSIVLKTSKYCSEEKTTIKDMLAKFQKEEKEIEHQRKKGTKTSLDMQLFMNQSAEEFLRQQEMRYRFFYEKHKSWFATYSNLFPQKENGFPEGTEKKNDVKQENEKMESATTVLSANDSTMKSNHSRVSPVETPVIQPSRSSTVRQENSTDISAIESNKSLFTSVNVTPMQEKQLVEMTQPKAVVDAATQSIVESPPIVHKESLILSQTPEQYVNNDWSNNIVEVPLREYAISNVERRQSYVPLVDPMVYQPEEPDSKQINNEKRPPVGGRLVLPPIENDRRHYHIESEFIAQPSPAHRASIRTSPKPTQSVVPPLFNNSDYGRILTVTQDFNATSGEQITVNRGNKVVLIKNGSRGWIFIKDADSQRTGWIPAPFVSY